MTGSAITPATDPKVQKIISAFTSSLGYTFPDFALYLKNGIIFYEYLSNCSNGEWQREFPASQTWLTDNYLILANVLASVALLSVSNQINIYQLCEDLFHKKDAAKNAGYQLVGGLNKHHLDNFHAFYKTVANIVGTTAKTFIMTGSVVKLLNMFFGNPRWVLGITMVVTMSTGQLAQFSILGKNDTIQLFEQVMLGSMDSAVVGGLVYGLMHYGFQMSSSFNVGMTVFNMTLLAESIHILRNNLAFSAYGYQKIRTCFFDQTTLIRSSSAQELGFSPIVPTARFSEKMIARISSILGYALPNALLYFFNDVWFNMYIKSCWEGQCNNGLKSNLEMLEKDLLIISACITTALLLLVSNSRSYEGRILDLFLKMRGTKTPGHAIEAEHTAEKIQQSLLKIADIISTQTKIRVTASGVTQFLKYFISDDWIPLGIAISLNVVFGQMAQFSIIGSKHGIEVFKPAFINSFETYFLSAAVFFVANYAFNSPNSVACAFVAYYSLQLLGAMMVALTGESFFTFMFDRMNQAYQAINPIPRSSQDDEEQPLINSEGSLQYS